jgi:hypothetical protein
MKYLLYITIILALGYFGLTIAKEIRTGLQKSVNSYTVALGLEK